jgi:hypothetical protein
MGERAVNAPHPLGHGQPRGADLCYATEPLSESDLPAVQALFQGVFQHPLPASVWHWKYAAGRGVGLGLRSPRNPGGLIAHYGGTWRRLRRPGGAVHTVAHLGDVMVAPEARAVFSRKGPFGQLTADFVARWLSGDARSADAGFGFPNARHMRLGELLGLYTPIDTMWQINGPTAVQPARASRVVALDWAAPSTDATLDQLWQHLAASIADMAVPERPAAWWRHRFAHHPTHTHHAAWLTDGHQPIAALVLRHVDATRVELLDWLGAADHTADVFGAAAHLGASLGAANVQAWVSEAICQRTWPLANWRSEIACPIGLTRALPGHAEYLAPEALHGRCWMTGGDTDFR